MRKSILKNIYFFTSRVVLCLLQRQQTVVQSITKAEHYALAKADYGLDNVQSKLFSTISDYNDILYITAHAP